MGRQSLAQLLSVKRRYTRSINLDRDFDRPEAVEGYLLTERALEALRRVLAAMFGRKRTIAWTLTGVYGTGKSAFAHFLTSLVGPADAPARGIAHAIARQGLQPDSREYQALQKKLPPQGLFRAVVTAQREPLSHTLVRAFDQAADRYWAMPDRPMAARKFSDWVGDLDLGQANFRDGEVLQAIRDIAEHIDTDILLVIDELGKSLEYAAQHQGLSDLYLLQQLAELAQKKQTRLYIFALLHQSFADYGQRLAAVEKNEWAKIQGRFEDIPFTESAQQMLRLMGQALQPSDGGVLQFPVHHWSQDWAAALADTPVDAISPALMAATYPLHPIAARVLPELCIRYAQNDRSLFTFLTSAEPHALQQFLDHNWVEDDHLPTLQLHHLYDYFVDSLGAGMGARPGLQRWLEIQTLVADAQNRGAETVALFKTIGLLNLVTSTGPWRATRSLVKLALVDRPDSAALAAWEERLVQVSDRQGLVTYRRAVDELRLWEGSDFDVEGAILDYCRRDGQALAPLLTETYPLQPSVAQRHSYRTGTLRYFERHYIDRQWDLNALTSTQPEGDGVIVYWLGASAPDPVPTQTADGKPLIIVAVANLPLLEIRAREYRALCAIEVQESALQTDAVARREVRHRRSQLKQLLDDTLTQSLNFALHGNDCWVQGEATPVTSTPQFNGVLSAVCDRVYGETPILWNELINRRVLTSQGAKARRVLIEAMLDQGDQPHLGLTGYGPEVAMYHSVLGQSGIHRLEQGVWGFYPPPPAAATPDSLGRSHLDTIWAVISEFCLGAIAAPLSMGDLYVRLARPPYGMKAGAIPVVLAAVLLHYSDEISVYKDGTFIPVLGPEHFELLVKDPSRFAVKYIAVTGIRQQVFRQLEAVLRGNKPQPPRPGVRNLTVLSVVKPLIQFVRKLPPYTLKTRRLDDRARAVLQTLLRTQEPDELLFKALPEACGLAPIPVEAPRDDALTAAFLDALVTALRHINGAYDALLDHCRELLYSAFGVHSDRAKLRSDLQFRASRLLGNCVEATLNRFARAAADEAKGDRPWLEAVVMVIADKPAESWLDEDVTRFELNLSDVSRRFKNLEALQASVKATSRGGFETRRVTVTRPDGTEINKMVWADHEHYAKVDPEIDRIFQQYGDPQLLQTLYTRLTERLFDGAESRGDAASAPREGSQMAQDATPSHPSA